MTALAYVAVGYLALAAATAVLVVCIGYRLGSTRAIRLRGLGLRSPRHHDR